MNPRTFLIIYTLFAIQILHVCARGTSTSADFVIVGAGTAGCALAGRLCANLPNAKIILIERGDPRNNQSEFLVRAPNNSLRTWNDSGIVEVYSSEPSKSLQGRTSVIITGKTLGGSSSVNGMQWSIPVRGTVDRWGIAGLNTRNWVRYLRRAYQTAKFGQPPKSLRQRDTDDYLQAGFRARFQEEDDQFSDEIIDGIWVNRLAIDDNARRVDSCTAYVTPVIDSKCRHNLQIIQSATVSRIILSDESPPRAVGVEYIKNGREKNERHMIQANKEVLLSAGPFESPKLLQLSGIGPQNVLKKAGVSVRVDLPVGTRSQGRAGIAVVSDSASVALEPSKNETLINSAEELMKWERGEGGLLSVAQSAINGRMKRRGYYTASFGVSANGNHLRVESICFLNSKSFGYVRIKNSDALSEPSVQLNLLGKRSDVRNGVSCMRRLRDTHGGLQKKFKLMEVFPGGRSITEELVLQNASFAFHFVGGCGVGNTVNEFLEVKRVRRLRVIDSSVFKVMPVSAGPLSMTYMLAEFMAERLWRIYK